MSDTNTAVEELPATQEQTPDPAPSSSGSSPTLLGDNNNPPPEPSATPSGYPLIGPDGQFVDGWLDQLPEELHDARDTLGRYKNFSDLAKGLYHTKQLVGSKADAIRIPGENAKPEEVAEYRKAIGVPETPDAYEIAKPETLPDELWDNDSVAKYAEAFHGLNIPKPAAQKLVQIHAEIQREQYEALTQEQEAKSAEWKKGEATALREKWGDRYEANLKKASQGASILGIDPNHPAFNSHEVVIAMARVAELTGEDRAPGGTSGGNMGVTPKHRALDIINNKDNPFHERWANGDQDINQMVTDLFAEDARIQKARQS